MLRHAGGRMRAMFLVVCPCGWRWFVSTPDGKPPDDQCLLCTKCDRPIGQKRCYPLVAPETS
jgi:hypothetical protein